jgi:hypothetical protein
MHSLYFLTARHFVFTKAHFATCMRLYNMALRVYVYTLSAIWQIGIHPPSPPHTTISIRNYPNYAILHAFTHINHGPQVLPTNHKVVFFIF